MNEFQLGLMPIRRDLISIFACLRVKASLAVLTAVLCISPKAALAQAVIPSGLTGSPTNTSDDLHAVDSVNTMNLGLNIEIPLYSLQERGRTSWVKFVYNTPVFAAIFYPEPQPGSQPDYGTWSVVAESQDAVTSQSSLSSNWRLVDPYSWSIAYDYAVGTATPSTSQCIVDSEVTVGSGGSETDYTLQTYSIDSNFRLVDPSGTEHPLAMQGVPIDNGSIETEPTGTLPPGVSGTGVCPDLHNYLTSPTLDGTGAYVDQTQNAFWLKDGTKYSLSPFTGAWTAPFVTSIEDANGNLIGQDMMNRAGLTTVTNTTTQTVYQYSDSNGNPQQITVNYISVPYQTSYCSTVAGGTTEGGSTYPCNDTSYTFSLVQSIILPNHQSYQFTYNQGGYAELTSMTLPTGTTISYTYGNITESVGNTISNKGGHASFIDGVSSRSEVVGGNTNTWSYTLSRSYNGSPGDWTTVTDPLGNCVHHSYGSVVPLAPLVEQTTIYQEGCGSGATLKTVSTSYAYDYFGAPNGTTAAYNIRPTAVITTLPNGQSSQVQTNYDSFTFGTFGTNGGVGTWLDPTEIREYDFGATTPTRTTDYTYLYNTGSSSQTAAQYLAHHIVSRISTKMVSNSSGPVVTTSYGYDNYGGGIATSGAVNLDTSYGHWGNATSQTVTDNISGKSYTSSYSYEDTGNMIGSTDPKGNITTYSYADSWSQNGASCALSSGQQGHIYLTKVANAKNQATNYSYNSCTGTLASITDPNSQTTSMQYDLLGRTAQISYPDGGQKSFSYIDSYPNEMVATQLATPSPSRTLTTIYDGLERPTQTQLLDGSSVDYVDTVYDGVGDVQSVSNPYRSKGESTYGVTAYQYDGLGRKTSQTQPDKNILQWCYDGVASTGQSNCLSSASSVKTGTWVDATDEVGNRSQRLWDGLGRLTAVMEPNPNTNALSSETDYQYDVFGGLTSVTQWGGASGSTGARTRSFTYDGLSRLLTAANPETGTVTYSYVSNGSLCAGDTSLPCSKTDARGVITSYGYDGLNRLLSKTYSNDPGTTPFSCYQYDLTLVQNGIGRLSNQWTQGASTGACPATAPSTGFVTKRSILAYDPMGRLLTEKQYTPASVAGGAAYSPSYTYDLAGDLISSSDGTTPSPTTPGSTLSFTNTYDNAQHLLSVTSNWVDAVHPSPLFSTPSSTATPPCANSIAVPYTAFGDLANATYGSGVTLNRAYDVRLRPICEIDAGSNAAATSGSSTVTITGSEQIKQ